MYYKNNKFDKNRILDNFININWLIISILLILFGVFFGSQEWLMSSQTGVPATAGTVIIAALPILVGSQLFISFLNFDVNYEPDKPIHDKL